LLKVNVYRGVLEAGNHEPPPPPLTKPHSDVTAGNLS
jgi:hypothetical protein